MILHSLAERNASCQRIIVLGFKGKQEDLFVNVVTEECALRVSVIYPSTSPRKPDFSSSRWNLCELFLPFIFLFHSDLVKYSDSSVTHIHDLLTRNYRIYHQDPEHERFKWQTFMESPIWGTKIQWPFQTRKAHKWEPPQLPALQKTRRRNKKQNESKLRSSSSSSLLRVPFIPVRSHKPLLNKGKGQISLFPIWGHILHRSPTERVV